MFWPALLVSSLFFWLSPMASASFHEKSIEGDIVEAALDELNQLHWPSVEQNVELIGSGAFGKIYLCGSTCDARYYVIKRVCKHAARRMLGALGSSVAPEDEAHLHWHLEHANILECVAIEDTMSCISYVLPYIHQGDAMAVLLRCGPGSINDVRDFYKNISGALLYIHRHGVAHRDVKLENVLVRHNSSNDVGPYCLTDFGFAKQSKVLTGCLTFIGTEEYMAPEVYLSRRAGIEYGTKVDIWGLGLCLFLLASASHPFSDGSLEYQVLTFDIAFEQSLWDNFPKEFSRDVSAMLRRIPCQRLSLPFEAW